MKPGTHSQGHHTRKRGRRSRLGIFDPLPGFFYIRPGCIPKRKRSEVVPECVEYRPKAGIQYGDVLVLDVARCLLV